MQTLGDMTAAYLREVFLLFAHHQGPDACAAELQEASAVMNQIAPQDSPPPGHAIH